MIDEIRFYGLFPTFKIIFDEIFRLKLADQCVVEEGGSSISIPEKSFLTILPFQKVL